MCLICIEIDKGRLTFEEGWRNLSEMEVSLEEDHIPVVKQKLIDKMLEEDREAQALENGDSSDK